MKIVVVTIFPELFGDFSKVSLIGKAIQSHKLEFQAVDVRDFSEPPHHKVDDIPYGGGAGMVMSAPPLLKAIRHARTLAPKAPVILLTPAGERFSQSMAQELSAQDLILVCGRYEGIDQRVIELEVDQEISLGDFVLMGGEVAAMAIIEATTRLSPGVIGNPDSLTVESFSNSNLLEAPQYTRPPQVEGLAVPAVLTSGDHAAIEKWRTTMSSQLTSTRNKTGGSK